MRKFVVILARDAEQSSKDVAAELQGLTGVEVISDSASFIDIEAEETLNAEDLKLTVQKLGGELHSASEPELMDPIPPSKIPF